MARIGPQTVRHIAQLAQLDLPEARLQAVASELSAIVEHMAAISDFVADTDTPTGGPRPRRRADVVQSSPTEHLIQAPTEGTEVCVPQVKDAS
jgi:Asp-tRNA(Asn)/Glu-tRNA(Gln) amidotransferase C subunit